MTKGRLSDEHWYIFREYPDPSCKWFHAERTVDGKEEHDYFKAHCLACAKTEILVKYGGKVDLRGWQTQGHCGIFLWNMQMMVDGESEG